MNDVFQPLADIFVVKKNFLFILSLNIINAVLFRFVPFSIRLFVSF